MSKTKENVRIVYNICPATKTLSLRNSITKYRGALVNRRNFDRGQCG